MVTRVKAFRGIKPHVAESSPEQDHFPNSGHSAARCQTQHSTLYSQPESEIFADTLMPKQSGKCWSFQQLNKLLLKVRPRTPMSVNSISINHNATPLIRIIIGIGIRIQIKIQMPAPRTRLEVNRNVFISVLEYTNSDGASFCYPGSGFQFASLRFSGNKSKQMKWNQFNEANQISCVFRRFCPAFPQPFIAGQ